VYPLRSHFVTQFVGIKALSLSMKELGSTMTSQPPEQARLQALCEPLAFFAAENCANGHASAKSDPKEREMGNFFRINGAVASVLPGEGLIPRLVASLRRFILLTRWRTL
jgi:hypothetical protein